MKRLFKVVTPLQLVILIIASKDTNQVEGLTLSSRLQFTTPFETVSRHREESTIRREILGTLVAIPIFASPAPATAASSPLDAGEAIRRAAANVPGYGQTDVFFPTSLTGNWNMIREVDFGNGRDPFRLSYAFRFIPSIEDDAVVADRGFNQAQLEKAISQTLMGKDESSSNVRSYEWVQTNPNDLRLILADGKRKEIKVTKRATERTESTVSSSEFQRITQEDQGGGIPDISARRIVTKWKVVDDNTIEGLEMIYNLGGGDPMSATSSTSSSPTLLSKSRMLLTR